MRFSIIITAYNQELYIASCLDSVLMQIDSSCELIIVDDGSEDGTPGILEKYGSLHSSFKILRQENSGPGEARNKGLRHATGDWIWFVDGDDKLRTGAIERLRHYIQAFPDVDLFRFGFAEFDNATGKTLRTKIFTATGLVDSNAYFSAQGMMPEPWAGLYRREFLLKAGIDFPRGCVYEDAGFNLLVYQGHAKMVVLPEMLYLYRIGNPSIMRSEVSLMKINSVVKLLEICSKIIANHREEEVVLAVRKKLDYLYLLIDHLYLYQAIAFKEKWAIFRSVCAAVPVLPNDSAGIRFYKDLARKKPFVFFIIRMILLRIGLGKINI